MPSTKYVLKMFNLITDNYINNIKIPPVNSNCL